MSRMVYVKGKLKLLTPLLAETLEDQCKRIVGYEISDYWESYVEYVQSEHPMYFINNGNLYEIVEEREISDDEDIFIAIPNGDGTINFELKYYNGGCSMEEALNIAFKKMKG